jgi:DHA2 family multidrug resistance protein
MGTGIINLARNIGASVGIASVTTLLERRTQLHMSQLGEHVNPYSEAYRNTLGALSSSFLASGSSATTAASRAEGVVYNMIARQATMLSFLDDFKLLGIVFVCIIPLFFLLKRPKMGGGNVPVH